MIADERWSCIDGSFEERLVAKRGPLRIRPLGLKKARFDLARKVASISLRLPAASLATPKANAAKANMRLKRIIHMMVEAQLAETAGPERKPQLLLAHHKLLRRP
jgi:predicted DNA binding CopG/RHH family protein